MMGVSPVASGFAAVPALSRGNVIFGYLDRYLFFHACKAPALSAVGSNL